MTVHCEPVPAADNLARWARDDAITPFLDQCRANDIADAADMLNAIAALASSPVPQHVSDDWRDGYHEMQAAVREALR